MKLRLNNSELNAILTFIDDALGYDLEPLERATYMNIVKKINNNISDSNLHKSLDRFVVDILNTDYEVEDNKDRVLRSE